MVEDRDTFCPSRCDKCNICNEMTEIFSELQDSYFFYPRTSFANNPEGIPYQPVLWRIFKSVINKSNKKFCIEIGKSVKHHGLVLNYGATTCAFICFLIRQYYSDKQNHCQFCHCFICKRLKSLLNEMDRWISYDLNSFHDKWFLMFHRKFDCQITLFPVFI